VNDGTVVNGLTAEAARLLGQGDPQLLPIETLERAGELLESAYKLMPDHPGVLYNVGNIRDELSLATGGPFVSMGLYERSLAQRVLPGALLNKGRILDLQENRHFEALDLYERAVIQQGLYRGAYGIGVCMLMCACQTDDPSLWRRGWYWFEHRIGKAEMKDHPGTWRGEGLQDKRLLIYTDFGLGDQVWGMRWIKAAKEWGATTVVVCGPEMHRLYAAQPYVDEAHVQGGGEGIEFDYLVPVMSMGTYMDPTSRVKTLAPYVEAPILDTHWAGPGHQPQRVGLSWQGSVTRGYPSWRNVPLPLLMQYLPLDVGIEYVSLQKSGEQLHRIGHPPSVDWESITHCNDLYDTAQLVRSLDLVVTIGSLMSMLAPALGVPTWLLNTYNSAWQFGTNERPVNWFAASGARFHQRKQGDWTYPLWELGQRLREWSWRQ
jgi:hypothetical protein